MNATNSVRVVGRSVARPAGEGRRTVVVIPNPHFRVETRYGTSSQCVDTLTVSFATAECALLVQRAIGDAVDAGLSDEQVRHRVGEAVAEALKAEYQLRREYGSAYADCGLIADLERALGIFPAADLDALAEALTGQAVA